MDRVARAEKTEKTYVPQWQVEFGILFTTLSAALWPIIEKLI
jgi:hypothetical protein